MLGNLLALPALLEAQSVSPGEPYLVPLGWLLGCCVFLADQHNAGYRFLAERGVPPRWVWASRQIVWFGLFLFWTVLTAIFLLVCTAAGNSSLELQFWEDFGLIVGIAILCYASSQVCSLAIRSGLVALACAAFASLQVVGWAVLMWQLGVSLWLSVVPLPVFLLWATWLHSPDWMLERSGLRSRVRGLASLLLPLGLIFAAAAAYREFEYPAGDPGFSLAEFTRPACRGRACDGRAVSAGLASDLTTLTVRTASRVESDRLGGVRCDSRTFSIHKAMCDVGSTRIAERSTRRSPQQPGKPVCSAIRRCLKTSTSFDTGKSPGSVALRERALEREAAGDLEECARTLSGRVAFHGPAADFEAGVITQDAADRLEWLVCPAASLLGRPTRAVVGLDGPRGRRIGGCFAARATAERRDQSRLRRAAVNVLRRPRLCETSRVELEPGEQRRSA